MSFEIQSISTDQELFDKLVCGELTPAEFKNNSVIIEEFSKVVDDIMKLETGYCLLTVDIRNKRNIIVISKDGEGSWYKYRVYSNTKEIPLDNPVSFKVHEIKNNVDLRNEISSAAGKIPYSINEKEILELIVTDTLDGYRINIGKLNPIIQMADSTFSVEYTERSHFKDNGNEDILELYDSLQSAIVNEKTNVISKLNKYITGLKCNALHIEDNIKIHGISSETEMSSFNKSCIASFLKVGDVKKIGNVRYAVLTSFTFYTTRTREISCEVNSSIERRRPEDRAYQLRPVDKLYYTTTYNGHSESWARDCLPYNFLDKGRMTIACGFNGLLKQLVVSNDPKIDTDYKAKMSDGMASVIKETIREAIDTRNVRIVDKDNKDAVKYMSLLRLSKKELTSTQEFMQSIKILTDEYKYVVKRQKAEGADVKITDNIIYNHTDSRLSYNDFSIKVNDEQLKNEIFSSCTELSVAYYRGTKTEQLIIDSLLSNIFYNLKNRIEGWSDSGFPVTLTFNDAVNITINREGKNNFTYINDQRFNRNEIIPIIREMTCYRDQGTANKFVNTIGRLGLSVYIGITTGYSLSSRIYRFKKNKGRSNYTLIIDDIEVNMKGKKVLNSLYEMTNGMSYSTVKKLDEMIFKVATSGYDYVKYKFLIDSSYKAFMEKSKKFLKDKIEEVEGEEVLYFDTTRKKQLSGVKVTGTSGKDYIVAYDSKESFVFMSPIFKCKEGEVNIYEKGNYICMIDQSNIKSNIGYDTVISKVMSLKHDSVIASRIYNLEDELNK